MWWHYPNSQTWRLEHRGEVIFLKLAKEGRYPSITDEADRLRWAADHIAVPKVIDVGEDDGRDWMVTELLRGTMAAADEMKKNPARLVPLLANGLNRFHELPVADCPFDFRVQAAVEQARRRVESGLVDAGKDFNKEHANLTPEVALTELEETRPEEEDLVVCHGDYCLPNVLIEDGDVVGFLDLGELGVADRWWDLAVGAWSVTWNLGPGWEDLFFRSYGAEPDPSKIRFYRLLYDMVS